MRTTGESRQEDLSRLLTDAIEVQLAALRAGIGFWSEWIEQTSAFVESATRTLSRMYEKDDRAKDSLLELVDAGRASLRSMTEIPRHTATRFIEELDKVVQTNGATKAAAKSAPPGTASAKKRAGRPRPKRSARVKP